MAITKRISRTALQTLAHDDPIPPSLRKKIQVHRNEIADILRGENNRLLVIVGPCSAWPTEAVLEYAERLAPLASYYSTTLKIVMRVYTQKPRTTVGWAGAVVQPDPYAPPNILTGARTARSMMREVATLGLPIADELLFTHKMRWVGDLLSWAAIGARSSEDHEHRVFASSLDMPVGLKNPTSGDLQVAANSVIAAHAPHTFYEHGYEVHTGGNPLAHLVLRGGAHGPNWRPRHVQEGVAHLNAAGIPHPAIVLDASHGNAVAKGAKDPRAQLRVARTIARTRAHYSDYRTAVRGIMLESFIHEGSQKLADHTCASIDRGGYSITDPCLSWEATAELLSHLARS